MESINYILFIVFEISSRWTAISPFGMRATVWQDGLNVADGRALRILLKADRACVCSTKDAKEESMSDNGEDEHSAMLLSLSSALWRVCTQLTPFLTTCTLLIVPA